MLRTNVYFFSAVIVSVVLATPVLCLAYSTNASRDAIIQKQMDCLGRNLKNTGVDWQDVCSMPDASGQEQKTEAVNQQLDTVENFQTSGAFQESPSAQPDARVFSNALIPDAQKAFPSMPVDEQKASVYAQPESASAVGMVKNIFDPDLSSNGTIKSPSKVKTRVHSLDLGLETFYYRYDEPSYVTYLGDTETNVKIDGPMLGFFAEYAYRPLRPSFLNNPLTSVYYLQARYAFSHDLEYDGTGVVKNKHDDVYEYRGLIGKDYFVGTNIMVTPYFGFGYRFLFDHGDGEISSENTYGYDRKSHYYYLPLGINGVFDRPNNWEIDPNIEYDIFLQGWQKSYLSDGNQFGWNNTDMNNRQDHGYGIRASVKFLKKGPLLDYYVEPFIRYWNIDQSKGELISIDNSAPSIYGEPANNTVEVGSRFGVQF